MSDNENKADIVTRLRDWRSLHLTRLGSLFDEAASHIELLEAADKCSGSALAVIDGGFKNAVAEIARLRLTDAEREAISRVYDLLCDRSRELQSATRFDEARPLMQWAKTLQGLWERTGGGE
jgi:hypothetical protein